MITIVSAGPPSRSRRRTTKYYKCTQSGNVGNPYDYIDPTQATDPNFDTDPVGGLFDPIQFAKEFSYQVTNSSAFSAGGNLYETLVVANPNATGWANALMALCTDLATGAAVGAGGAIAGAGTTFNLAISGPTGSF